MALAEEMPADSLADIEESNLQRDIAAVEWRKKEEGITWAQYLGGTTVKFCISGYFEHSATLRDRVHVMGTEIMPRLQEAERLNSPDFPGIQREVIIAVQDALIVQRELMDTIEIVKE